MRRSIVAVLAMSMFLAFVSFAAAAVAPPKLTEVAPWQYDPFKGSVVESDWLNHIGCPFKTEINTYNAAGVIVAGTYTDPGCPVQYRADPNVQGLLLAKTGPTANIAAAGAELKGVGDIVLTSIGYDIRKHGGYASPLGSHCGAGAPRFNVVTNFGTHFIGCASPPPISQTMGEGWTRLAWSPAAAFPPIIPGTVVQSIDIVFDEGTDTGPDYFGIAILDNVMVNGVSVGHRTNPTP
jgi:hypothetical protein